MAFDESRLQALHVQGDREASVALIREYRRIGNDAALKAAFGVLLDPLLDTISSMADEIRSNPLASRTKYLILSALGEMYIHHVLPEEVEWVGHVYHEWEAVPSTQVHYSWKEFEELEDITVAFGEDSGRSGLTVCGPTWWMELHNNNRITWWSFRSIPVIGKASKRITPKSLAIDLDFAHNAYTLTDAEPGHKLVVSKNNKLTLVDTKGTAGTTPLVFSLPNKGREE